MDKLMKKKTCIVFSLYFLAVLVLTAFHEPWEDELQVWCIARDLSLPELLHQMRYEGHFALWYLLIKPFALAGLPVLTMNLISLLLVSSAVLILLFSTRLPWTINLPLLFSAPLLCWFPVIARNYALIPLALCLIAGLYPIRMKRPFVYACSLLLLVHTHAYMEGLAGILGAFFLWDLGRRCIWQDQRGKHIRTALAVLLLLSVGVAAAFLQVAPAFGTSSFAPASAGNVFSELNTIPSRIGNVLLQLPNSFSVNLSRLCGSVIVSVLFYLCLLTALIQLFLTRRRAAVFFLAGFLWQILFAALIYPMGLQRVYLPLLMLVFCFALPGSKEHKKKPYPLRVRLKYSMLPVGILALMTWPDAFHYAVSDIQKPFSNQLQTAEFIRSELPADAKIVVFPPFLISGTFRAYLPERTFFRCSDGQPFRIFQTEQEMPAQLDTDLLNSYCAGHDGDVYLLFQIGSLLHFFQPPLPDRIELDDFILVPVFCSYPLAFCPAGEDYLIFRLVRK